MTTKAKARERIREVRARMEQAGLYLDDLNDGLDDLQTVDRDDAYRELTYAHRAATDLEDCTKRAAAVQDNPDDEEEENDDAQEEDEEEDDEEDEDA